MWLLYEIELGNCVICWSLGVSFKELQDSVADICVCGSRNANVHFAKLINLVNFDALNSCHLSVCTCMVSVQAYFWGPVWLLLSMRIILNTFFMKLVWRMCFNFASKSDCITDHRFDIPANDNRYKLYF